MSERVLKRQMRGMTVVAVLLCLAVLLAGWWAASALRNMLQQALQSQMETETARYRLDIERRMEVDQQTLRTLSGFAALWETDPQALQHGLEAAAQQGDYTWLGYFDTSGEGFYAAGEQGAQPTSLQEIDGQVAALARNALQGQSGVSRIYTPEGSGYNRFAYAVPAVVDGKVVGAVAAGCSVEAFAGILDTLPDSGRQGAICLISDSGKVLVRPQSLAAGGLAGNVFETPGFGGENGEALRSALLAGESCFVQLKDNNVEYWAFAAPMGVNGWYLLNVQTAQNVSNGIYSLMSFSRWLTVAALLAVLALIWGGYRAIYKRSAEIIQRSCYDPLTGAYNLPRFEDEVRAVLQAGRPYSLAALNVRQFKFINEIFGRAQADTLLCRIKQVIEAGLRPGECFCRSGQDLFYILFLETGRAALKERIQNMMDEVGRYAMSKNRDYQLLLYCGVAVSTEFLDSEPTVQKGLTHVGFALHTARQSIKHSIWFYDTRLHEDEKLVNYVESRMRQALSDGEFTMYLQPKVSLATGKVAGAEALVRWITAEGKTIYPGQFIPVFEDNGFCVELDLYMVEEACKQIAAWQKAGKTPLPLSVNQSKLLFFEADYVERLQAILARYGVPAHMITLEILEGLAMENREELNEKIDRLHAVGFSVSMDDFGSGYSSLNTLAALHIDELKLDRVFLLQQSGTGEERGRQKVILKEILHMARELSISTVAEGVETAADEALLKELGCGLGQGYYYSRPIPAGEFTEKYLRG